jgi:Aspartyl protease
MTRKCFQAARIHARVRSNPIQPIVDSGAAASIITKHLAMHLKLKWTEESDINILAVDGQKRRVIGVIDNAPIAVADALVPINLLVIES